MKLNTSPAAGDLDLRVDITWVNLYDGTDWTILRFKSSDPIDQLVMKLGNVIEKKHFEHLFSVSASKHALHIIVGCMKPLGDIKDDLFL